MAAEPASSQPPFVQVETAQSETARAQTTQTETNWAETSEPLTAKSKSTPPEATRTDARQQQTTAKSSATETSEITRSNAAALANLRIPDDWQPLPHDPHSKCPNSRSFLYRGTVLHYKYLLVGAPQYWARYRGRSSDVIVASFPKSGTTWLQEIVWRLVHREPGSESGGGKTLEYRFPLLDIPSVSQMQMASLHDMESPRLIKTHMMYHLLPESVHTSGAKLLYIRRDPRDVCVSYYHFDRMVKYELYDGTFSQYRDKFVGGRVLYGPYREHVKGYLDHADTVLCVSYEQLHEDRVAVVLKVAEFLGTPVTKSDAEDIARYTDFENMSKNPACNFRHWENKGIVKLDEDCRFMRKGKVGDWKNYFTEEESAEFMKWVNEPI